MRNKLLIALFVLAVSTIFVSNYVLGANVIQLQTDNAKSITSTDYGSSKTMMDVGFPAGITGTPMSNATSVTTATTTGGTLEVDTYYFKVTTVDGDGGETAASSESSCTVGSGEGPDAIATSTKCLVSMTINPKASSTRLWVSTVSGTYTSYVLATGTTGVATTVGLTTGTLPTTNSAFDDLKIGRYDETAQNLTDGESSQVALDANGYVKTNIQSGTVTAVTDITNPISIASTSNPITYSYNATTSQGIIATGNGTLHTVTFMGIDAAATAGTIQISDSITSTSSPIVDWVVPAAALNPFTITLDLNYTTGLFIDFDVTADVKVLTTYK